REAGEVRLDRALEALEDGVEVVVGEREVVAAAEGVDDLLEARTPVGVAADAEPLERDVSRSDRERLRANPARERHRGSFGRDHAEPRRLLPGIRSYGRIPGPGDRVSRVKTSRKRRRAIRRRARKAVELWHRRSYGESNRQLKAKEAVQYGSRGGGSGAHIVPGEAVVGAIPRRKTLFGGKPPEGDRRPAMVKKVSFSPTFSDTLFRLLLW